MIAAYDSIQNIDSLNLNGILTGLWVLPLTRTTNISDNVPCNIERSHQPLWMMSSDQSECIQDHLQPINIAVENHDQYNPCGWTRIEARC